MDKPVGGRGKKVPYSTVVVRIPSELTDIVEQLAEQYRKEILLGNEFVKQHSLSLDIAILETKKIIRGKHSKIDSLVKLLQVIYRTKAVSKDSLT